MKVKFERRLVIKGAKKDFGLGRGVLVTQVVTYTVPDRSRATSRRLAFQMLQERHEFVDQYVKVVMKEIKPRRAK
jgi:hypothetical protein